MTNKEKLEIIDKILEALYEELSDLKNFTTDAQHNITQSIYNLETIKLGLLIDYKNELKGTFKMRAISFKLLSKATYRVSTSLYIGGIVHIKSKSICSKRFHKFHWVCIIL